MTSDTILAAVERLRGHLVRTPTQMSVPLSSRTGAEVWLKLENLQHTGSFKARGALNKVLTLRENERAQGIIAASSGNHGIAVAWSAQRLGLRARIYVPEGASPAKVEKIRALGATVEFHGTDGLDTEIQARGDAEREGLTYVSPYNDADVVAGQATVGVELLEQAPDLDAVVVAVGGGGLIGGIGSWIKQVAPNVRVIGALPAHSPVMAASIRAGRIVEMPTLPTLSDGTAGGIEADALTFALCQQTVDDWVVVEEDSIARSLRTFVQDHDMVIEGAAAVAVAAAADLRASRVAVVICGGNIATDRLAAVMDV